jgi:hypothetical protein
VVVIVGSLEETTALITPRAATKELYDMSDPTSEIFASHYLPAMQVLVQRGVVVVPIASFRDRVVSLASATTDGLQHPNIIRGLYVHSRYLPPIYQRSSGSWSIFARSAVELARDIVLELSLLAIHLRNCGYHTDLARFCCNKSETAISTGLTRVCRMVVVLSQRMRERDCVYVCVC